METQLNAILKQVGDNTSFIRFSFKNPQDDSMAVIYVNPASISVSLNGVHHEWIGAN